MKKIKSLKSDLPEDTVPSLVVLTVAVRHGFLHDSLAHKWCQSELVNFVT